MPPIERILVPRRTFVIAGMVSAALLAGAHAFERIGGLAPCLLCLDQREVHWAVLATALLGIAVSFLFADRRVLGAGLIALTAVLLYSAGLGAFHAGVEWDFWDGPMACAAGGSLPALDPGQITLGGLEPSGLEGPPCEVAAWRMLGISMAGYNALISLVLAVFTGAAAWRLVKEMRGANIQEKETA